MFASANLACSQLDKSGRPSQKHHLKRRGLGPGQNRLCLAAETVAHGGESPADPTGSTRAGNDPALHGQAVTTDTISLAGELFNC